MRTSDEIRADLLAALAQLSHLCPEWRLGQTLANIAMMAGKLEASGVWDLEDDEALAAATLLIKQHSEVEAVVA